MFCERHQVAHHDRDRRWPGTGRELFEAPHARSDHTCRRVARKRQREFVPDQMGDNNDLTSVERVIAVPPSTIFDLLADPSRYREFDG